MAIECVYSLTSTKKLVRREGYVVGYLVVLRKYIEKAVHMGG
jgi:hypothetical protein